MLFKNGYSCLDRSEFFIIGGMSVNDGWYERILKDVIRVRLVIFKIFLIWMFDYFRLEGRLNMLRFIKGKKEL